MTHFDVLEETIDIINKNEYYIDALLRLQLQIGKDGNDENVRVFGRDYYSDRTVFDKEHGNYPALGKVTEFITNYKTGEFYKDLKTEAQGTTFVTTSRVPYFDEIIARSGDSIMKLNAKHRHEFVQEILLPELRKRFKLLENAL